MNILILSNGYGEDGVGSKLVDTINKKSKNRNNFYVMPIVGSGDIYKKNDNVNLLACNKVFKCSGFLRSFKYLLNDIKNGLIGYHLKQIRELQKLNKKIKFDEITAVGDFFLVLISLFISKRRIYFLPTAKSDYFQKHLWIEKIIMKMKCKKVFPRDELTHNSFKNYGISSQYLGNVLMDTIEDENDD